MTYISNCLDLFRDKTPVDKKGELLDKIINDWYNSKAIQAATFKDSNYFKKTYREITGKDFDYDPDLPSMRKLKKLERKIPWMESQVKKDHGAFGKWFKLPGAIMDKNPITAQYRRSLAIHGDKYTGNLEKHISNLDAMIKHVNADMELSGAMTKFNLTKPKAQKKLQEMEAKFKKYRSVDESYAKDYYEKNLSREALLEDKNGIGLKTLQSFYELIHDPTKLYSDMSQRFEKYVQFKDTAKYGGNLRQAAHIWHRDISPELFNLTKKGLDAYIETMQDVSLRVHGVKDIGDNLKKLRDSLVKQKDYVPVEVLDIFPTLSRLNQDIYSNKISEKDYAKKVSSYVDDMYTEVKNNLSPSKHIKTKSAEGSQYPSKDVLTTLDKYIKNVVRFNFTSQASKDVINAVRKLERLEGGLLDKQAEFLTNYIRDTHADAIGINMVRDSKLALFARSLTAWQFMSKLGFNIRSAARNATQSLQNWVYFGTKAIREAYSWEKKDKMNGVLETEMKKHGVFFADIEELAYKHEMTPKTKIVEKDGRTYVQEVEPGSYENMLRVFENSKFQKAAGYMMTKVENKINRSSTFRIAFTQQYRYLNGNDAMVRRAVERNKKHFMKNKGDENKTVSDLVEAEIIRKSSRFAAEAVKELHYDYAMYAKPKALRTPVGAIMGQFSTYSINFFEYQRKIFAEGGRDLISGDIMSIEALRAYRMASFYSVVQGILAPLFNMDLANLIENDTLERIEGLYWYFAADPDDHLKYQGVVSDPLLQRLQALPELKKKMSKINPNNITADEWNTRSKKELAKIIQKNENNQKKDVEKVKNRIDRAFPGTMGPMSMFLGPSVNSLIFLGNFFMNMNMDENDISELSQTYKSYGDVLGEDAVSEDKDVYYDLARELNPQIARSMFYTIPNLINGSSAWTVGGQELGLWPPRHLPFRIGGINERRQAILQGIRKVAPESLESYLTPDKEEKEKLKGRKIKLGGIDFSVDEVQNIMRSLDNL